MQRSYGKSLLFIVAVLGVLVPGSSWGRSIKGVEVPEQVTVGEDTLQLQGVGVRKKLFLSWYVAALHLQQPGQDAETVRPADATKRLTLYILRDVGSKRIRDSYEEGFFNNAQEQLPQLRERIDRLLQLFEQGVAADTRVVYTYRPEQGTRVQYGSGEILIEGRDFMQALWGIWLGEVPADADLKRQLLGTP